MELVRERQTIDLTNAELEAQRHNAQISERYRLLQNAEADQFASEKTAGPVFKTETPVFVAPVEDTPVVEQMPQVTDFVREKISGSVFTAEKFERLQTSIDASYVAPVIRQETQKEVAVEERYGLTPFAKIAMAVVTFVILAMLALIGVNSAIIRQKNVRIQQLEEDTQELQNEYASIMARIQEVHSEESILAWAEKYGVTEMDI